MRDPWKLKTASLYGMLRKCGPVRVTLEGFRGWLNGQATSDLAWRCEYCRGFLALEQVSIDHEIPVKMGGPNTIANFAVCCRNCNEIKGGMSHWTFGRIMDVLNRCGTQERADVLGRLRSGQWRTARARGYKRRRKAA